MEKIKKLFGKINISWKVLITFSIVIGIVVGVLNRIPFLENTSFQDIAIVLDMWIILAIFVIANCKTWKEAASKCFIFFLISQPLIYFTEILIDVFIANANFRDTFIRYFKNYYIGAGWFTWTFLTIPGAFIAYQIKKNNVLSAIVLSVATTYLAIAGTRGLKYLLINHVPNHLLNSLICLSMAYILIFAILKNKKERIICMVITTIGVVIGIVLLFSISQKPKQGEKIIDFDETIEMIDTKTHDEDIATTEIDNDGHFFGVYSSKKTGTTEIKLVDNNENEYIYKVNATKEKFEVNLVK